VSSASSGSGSTIASPNLRASAKNIPSPILSPEEGIPSPSTQ
jgi:hypothetical protein